MHTSSQHRTGLDALRRDDGTFAMVALDQRESLRAMLSRPGAEATDADLTRFKAQAAAALSPHASAVLLDVGLGLPDGPLGPDVLRCPLIVAVDRFTQEPGRPVADSVVDPGISASTLDALGAAAIKLLLIWRDDTGTARRHETVAQFLELARAAGVPAILEGVVRPRGDDWTDGERDDTIVAAAADLGGLGADLYKAEVPDFGARPDVVRARTTEMTSVLPGPWVVLSTGVEIAAFPAAVAAARAGGASGFLAGRGVWSEATRAADRNAALRGTAVERLRALIPPAV